MVNINAIRYFLYEEAGVVLYLISIFLSIIAFLSGIATMKWISAVSIFMITIVLVGNYIDLKNIHSIESPQDSPEKVQGNSYVPEQTQDSPIQEPVGGTEAEKGDEAKHSKLLLEIVNWEHFNFGFYYEYLNPENPNMNYIIDFDTGIFGTFQYSQELTETERSNWFHGGKLYDIDEYEIGVDGN